VVLLWGAAVWLIRSGLPRRAGSLTHAKARRRTWLWFIGLGFVAMASLNLVLGITSPVAGLVTWVYWFGWTWISWLLADRMAARRTQPPLDPAG
jgi:hypothetical protein